MSQIELELLQRLRSLSDRRRVLEAQTRTLLKTCERAAIAAQVKGVDFLLIADALDASIEFVKTRTQQHSEREPRALRCAGRAGACRRRLADVGRHPDWDAWCVEGKDDGLNVTSLATVLLVDDDQELVIGLFRRILGGRGRAVLYDDERGQLVWTGPTNIEVELWGLCGHRTVLTWNDVVTAGRSRDGHAL